MERLHSSSLSDLIATIQYYGGDNAQLALILTPGIYGLFLATLYHPEMELLTATPEDREPPLGLVAWPFSGLRSLFLR